MEEKMADRHEFHNDLEVYCSAQEHKGMALDLIRVYGPTAMLKDVLADINYQLDKYENILFTHNLQETKDLAGTVISSLTDIKETQD
jgi:Holliday junction resolvasome RuvABC ATP-dependent DNA helicase subunit